MRLAIFCLILALPCVLAAQSGGFVGHEIGMKAWEHLSPTVGWNAPCCQSYWSAEDWQLCQKITHRQDSIYYSMTAYMDSIADVRRHGYESLWLTSYDTMWCFIKPMMPCYNNFSFLDSLKAAPKRSWLDGRGADTVSVNAVLSKFYAAMVDSFNV